jgi:hypothetical protein
MSAEKYLELCEHCRKTVDACGTCSLKKAAACDKCKAAVMACGKCSKAQASAIDPTKPITPKDLPGGKYPWADNHDGTFNVLDVPILAALAPGEFPRPRNEEPIDAAWMRKAIETARAREAEGHVGSVHVHHHDDGEQVEDAGKLQLSRVGEVTYEGQKKDALFANLIRVPKAIFERIAAGQLPYRSIEGQPWNKHEVDSLSLMPTKTPFWRLPMLGVGDRVAAASNNPERIAFLSYFPLEGTMAAEVKAGMQPPPSPANNQPGPPQAQAAQPAAPPPDDGKRNIVAKLMKLVAEFTGNLIGSLESMLGGSDSEKDGKESEFDKRKTDKKPAEQQMEAAKAMDKPAEVAPAPAPAPVAEPVKAAAPVAAPAPAPAPEPKHREEIAAKDAEISALRAQLKARDGEGEDVKAVDAAMAKLNGYFILPEVKAQMLATRKVGGQECLDIFVAAYAKHAPKDPPKSLTDSVAASAASATVASVSSASPDPADAILNKLGPQSPVVMAAARKIIPGALAYCAQVPDTKPEDYVLCELRHEGLIPRA